MRSLLIVFLLLAAAAVAVVARSRDDAGLLPLATADAESPAEIPAARPEATGERTFLAGPRGVITGRIVDPDGQPLAEAHVQLAIADASDALPQQQTARDGRFMLIGVPLQLAAVCVTAPGFASAQLGDLHPELAPMHLLDLGTLTLQRATLYHGAVRSLGRALANADVALLPELGEPGAAVPLVQHAVTDTNGSFLFSQGPMPPCYVQVRAEGHRVVRPLRVMSLQQPLQFDLEPFPHVTGRVLRGSDSAPATDARVWLWPLTGVQLDAVLNARPDPDASLAVAVGVDGSFDLVLPDVPQFALQVECAGHVARVFGPLAGDRAHGPLPIVLQPGIVVQGEVTWRGEPIGALATLWSDRDQRVPQAMTAVAADGRLNLPPMPAGRWLLRVDAEHGARFERAIDLALPGPLALEVVIPEGTRLEGSVLGARPTSAAVVCSHESGAQRRGLVHPDGGFVVEALFPGRWRAHVQSNPGDWQSAAAAFLADLVDDPGFAIGDEAVLRVDIASPTRTFGRIRGQLPREFAGARVELIPGDERQQRVPPGLQLATVGDEGAFVLDPVLPGDWVVQLTGSGHAPRRVNVLVVAGDEANCCFLD